MASGVLARHWNGKKLFFVFTVKVWRKAMTLIAENEPCAFWYFYIVEALWCFRAAEDHVFRMIFFDEFGPIFV